MMHQDITVIVQGPMEPWDNTKQTISSIRKFLPNAKILLSTWDDTENSKLLIEKISELGPDEFVLSQPIQDSPIVDPIFGTRSNLARMIITTLAGLKLVKTEYSLKLRTDTPITSLGFLENWNEIFGKRIEKFSIFDQKIVIPNVFTRAVFPPSKIWEKNPKWPAPLHISDWSAFGTTSDLIDLYSVELPTSKYFDHMVSKWNFLPDDVPYRFQANYQFPPEMWLGLHSVGIKIGLSPQDWASITPEEAEIGKQALISNFVVVNAPKYGISSNKYDFAVNSPGASPSNMTTRDYALEYDEMFGTQTVRHLEDKEYIIRILRFAEKAKDRIIGNLLDTYDRDC